jgi:hypothetical protein
MNTSCILAPLAMVGGARSTCIFGRSVRLLGFVFLLKQAGSVPKEKNNECDGKTTNLVVAKKKGGNRLTSIFFYECPPYFKISLADPLAGSIQELKLNINQLVLQKMQKKCLIPGLG